MDEKTKARVPTSLRFPGRTFAVLDRIERRMVGRIGKDKAVAALVRLDGWPRIGSYHEKPFVLRLGMTNASHGLTPPEGR